MTIRGNDDMNRELAPIAQSEEQRPSNQPLHQDGDSGIRNDPANVQYLADREPFAWYGDWDEDDQFIPLGHEGAHIGGLCWCDKLPSAAEYAEKRKLEDAERAWQRTLERSVP